MEKGGFGINNIVDLTGKTFGRLTVIKRAENRGKTVYWLCKCECGNTKEIMGKSLKNGDTRSCGCTQRNITCAMRTKDLTGQEFGRLTIIKSVGRKKGSFYTSYVNANAEIQRKL